MNRRVYKTRTGFTLVETLVAASIFVILTTIAVGAFVQALKSQRLLTSLLALQGSVGSTVEQVERELRTGYGFCSPDFPETCDSFGIYFLNYEGAPTSFRRVEDADGRGSLFRNDDRITAANVDVRDVRFEIHQDPSPTQPGLTDESLCSPWRIIFAMRAISTNPELANIRPINIQATVSSRVMPRDAPNASTEIKNLCLPVGG